ncbi:capsule biosynthesis protein [Qipengyuania oceanensis]|uniref:Capsule biosynthesis protein n=1 Tax=Qipengyuania oceanensis TaxID=1463597 RepID=A0A844YHB5_9SPHN|nr:capsule biosynthesis protein [Qipengyuania oceanensis]MXO63103.1 capsule biosynthesis protein [Qipengyuania oceanensis]
MTTPIITTLAEYQTEFWIPVAKQLRALGHTPHFISFDNRSTELLQAEGFAVRDAYKVVLHEGAEEEILASIDMPDFATISRHERYAFGTSDNTAMRRKLARAIQATHDAIRDMPADARPIIIQELGGFLSVIGVFYAARDLGLDNLFIEPSFFRGRLLFTANSFLAPSFRSAATAAPDSDVDEYLAHTVTSGSLVIPAKDRHHYASALGKMLTKRNAIRLWQKSVDKYVLGKKQEFGFIGHHVAVHLRNVLNSRRLAAHYTPLERLGSYIYYPLHVPGDVALTIRSPAYLDQLALVEELAASLPPGTSLAIKEHPAMVGMIEVGRLKDLLARRRNVAILPPATNNYQVMRGSQAVVTVNSKSGAEAGLLDKPVIVLGNAFYRDAPFANAVENPGEAAVAIKSALSGSTAICEHAAKRGWFAGLWRETLPGELYDLDPDNIRQVAQTLLEALDAHAARRGGSTPAKPDMATLTR